MTVVSKRRAGQRARGGQADESVPDAVGHPKAPLRYGLTAQERQRARDEAVLNAALELFGTRGYADTSVKDVCQAANVSSRDFYASFDNREELLLRLARRLAGTYTTACEQAFQASRKRTRRARLLDGLHASIVVAAQDDRQLRVSYVETTRVSSIQVKVGSRVLASAAQWLAEAFREEFAKARISPEKAEQVCFAVLGAINQLLAYHVLTGSKRTAKQLADDVIGTIDLILPI